MLARNLKHSTLVRIGAAAMLLGSIPRLFTRHLPDFQHGLVDGMCGAFLGIAIAMFYLAARAKQRRDVTTNTCSD